MFIFLSVSIILRNITVITVKYSHVFCEFLTSLFLVLFYAFSLHVNKYILRINLNTYN